MTEPGVLISSRIFVPEDWIDPDKLSALEILKYNENTCARCPTYKAGDRHCGDCDNCPAFLGIDQLWDKKRFKGENYIALPPGRPERIAKRLEFDISKAQDLRLEIPFKHRLKFTGELYRGQIIKGRQTVDQVAMVAGWLRKKTGIIEVPPRGGKTVISAAAICALGLKTIIIAHEGRLLKQFRRTFRGNSKRSAFTNAKQLERQAGQPVVKIITKMSDFTPDVDVALVNYQKFIRSTQSIANARKYINDHFSLMVVDEVHMGGALAYLRFIKRLNCKYRMGLTATVDRKDGQSELVKHYMGDTVAKSKVTAMIPEIELVETSVTPKYSYKSWPYAMKFLYTHKKRERMILREVFKDLRAGHKIIIPLDVVAHGQKLTDLINQQAEYRREEKGEKWSDETAVFYSNQIRNKADLEKILDRFDRGRHRVLVAIRSKIRMGTDLVTPTMLYAIVPMSGSPRRNEHGKPIGAPMFYQLSHRVSTWMQGKRQPCLKIFIDNMPQSLGCFKSLFWQEIWPSLKGKHPRYKMSPPNLTRAFEISKMPEYIPPGKAGERIAVEKLIARNKSIAADNDNSSQSRGGGFIGMRRR